MAVAEKGKFQGNYTVTHENCKERMATLVLAHRGAVEGGAEASSIGAFDAARRLGADGVELDVRRSADGALVVVHDQKVPGGDRVANLAAADLPPGMPLLADVLAACEGLVVDVELKHDPGDDPDRRLAAALAQALAGARPMEAAAPGRSSRSAGVLVSSFDAASLEAVRERAPAVPTGLLVQWTGDPWVALDAAVAHRCAAVHPFVTQVDQALVAEAHRRGLAVNVWTVNADADLVAMVSMGVDAVITDRVPAALAALGRTRRNGGRGVTSSTIGA
ncbi:MAG: glycerophosphodiester phosphodiesterase [Acidimicrobiales bacterium]